MKKFMLPLTLLVFYVGCIFYSALAKYPHPDQTDLGPVIYLRQPSAITCGPVSTLMLLLQYEKDVTLQDVQTRTRTKWFSYKGKDIGMTSPDYIAYAMKQLGVPARLKHGKIDMLKYYVSERHPCIVLLRSSLTTWHYVLVTGYTPEKIIMADPGIGLKREMDLHDFLGSWAFTTDMRGQPLVGLCPLCHGTGRWLNANLGPFGICEICNGTGKQPDYLSSILKGAEVLPFTLIVPNDSLSKP